MNNQRHATDSRDETGYALPWKIKPEMLYKGQRIAGRSPTVIDKNGKEIAKVYDIKHADFIVMCANGAQTFYENKTNS